MSCNELLWDTLGPRHLLSLVFDDSYPTKDIHVLHKSLEPRATEG